MKRIYVILCLCAVVLLAGCGGSDTVQIGEIISYPAVVSNASVNEAIATLDAWTSADTDISLTITGDVDNYNILRLREAIRRLEAKVNAVCTDPEDPGYSLNLDFSGCTELQFPASCFMSCYILSTIKLPACLTDISRQCFLGCENLVSVEFHGSELDSIGSLAFYNCVGLKGANKFTCTDNSYEGKIKVRDMFGGNPFCGLNDVQFPYLLDVDMSAGTGRTVIYTQADTSSPLIADLTYTNAEGVKTYKLVINVPYGTDSLDLTSLQNQNVVFVPYFITFNVNTPDITFAKQFEEDGSHQWLCIGAFDLLLSERYNRKFPSSYTENDAGLTLASYQQYYLARKGHLYTTN